MSTLENGAVETVSSVVPPPACTNIQGCVVKDADEESTVTHTAECPSETVTDVVITCSGTGTTACSTKTEVAKTGCSLTATTTTVSCTPAPSGGNTRKRDGDDSGPFCQTRSGYSIWPRDETNLDEAKATWDQMTAIIGDGGWIENLQDRKFTVDFWRATLSEDEAQAIREIPSVSLLSGSSRVKASRFGVAADKILFCRQVSGVYADCTDCDYDPTTAWVFQRVFKQESLDGDMKRQIGAEQMAYLSFPPSKNKKFDDMYVFDDSAGSDIPVYIVDTGAQLMHSVRIYGWWMVGLIHQ